MDPFTSFFSAQLLFYALAIFAITFVIRTVIEYFWKGAQASAEWNNLILPLLPIVLGAIMGIFSKMYPDPLGTSIFARETFSLTAGLISGLVYKMLKGYIKSQFSTATITTTTATPTSTTNITTAPVITPDATTNTTTNVVTVVPSTTTSTTVKMSGGMSSDSYPKL